MQNSDKIIKTMDMKISEVWVPKLLAEILSDAEVFVKEKNFPLLELCKQISYNSWD